MAKFSDDFLWGAATASYQIEGAARTNGRGLSVWDMFCDTPGKVFEGHNGDIACDHYHRYKEDVALMKELGLKGYRFSLSWSRILPSGVGAINQEGVDFYNSLIDTLLEAGITPAATLFHWDFPLDLFKQGGWAHADSSKWFEAYTQVCAEKFGDRLKFWMTLNEPQVFMGLGHQDGIHAPGLKEPFGKIKLMTKNAIVAHGRAISVLRSHDATAKLGIAPVGSSSVPKTESPADIEAARKSCFGQAENSQWPIPFWMDPIMFGEYRDLTEETRHLYPEFTAEEFKIAHQPLDFVGLNVYQAPVVQAGPDGAPQTLKDAEGAQRTFIGWYVRPESLYWAVRFFNDRYPSTPIYITENGLSNQDWVHLDGKVHDPQRIDFLTRYLHCLGRAAEEGVDLRGYFHWSLLDNFEWAEGYKERFGLIYVDYPTGKRIPKDSYYWYKQVIANNGGQL